MKPIGIIKKVIIAFCLVATAAIGGELPSIDPTIAHVAQGGLWRQGEAYGTCRLLVQAIGWEETRSLVYLQWLLTDDRKKAQVDQITVPVKEMNEGGWMNVEAVNYRDGKFSIVYTSWASRETRTETFIIPMAPGKYAISK